MTDKLIKERDQGAADKALLENQTFKNVCERIRSHYVNEWEHSDDLDVRENAHRMVSAIRFLKEELTRSAAMGRQASKELSENRNG